MRKALPGVLCLFLCISLFLDTSGQVKGQQEKKFAVLKKDTAYKRFQSQLSAIMKTAKGRKTNYAAVKSLFDKNKVMLDGLKKRYDLTTSAVASTNSNKIALIDRPLARLVNTSVFKTNIYEYVLTGPFTDYIVSDDANVSWDKTSSNNKISFTADCCEGSDLWSSAFGFPVTITAPNNPQIIGVRIEFDYSVFMTGWNTDGGKLATLLGIFKEGKFESPAYNSLSTSTVDAYLFSEGTYFKTAREFLERDFDQTDEYTYSRDATFAIEGYVTPGELFKLVLIAGYGSDSKMGNNRGYHYGEFELKKVSVKFLKAGE